MSLSTLSFVQLLKQQQQQQQHQQTNKQTLEIVGYVIKSLFSS